MTVGMDRCRTRLAILWFSLSALIFALVLLSCLGGYYGTDFAWVWGWLLPTLMPTLSLIIGVLVVEALRPPRLDRRIRPFLYRLAFGLSCAYLALVLLTFVAQPYTALPPHLLLEKSQLWLAPVQGLVTASLGAFFVKGEDSAVNGSAR